MGDERRRWSEPDTQRWLTWLARTMQRRGQTQFLLEEMQPTWLRAGGDMFFDADLLLGCAIGLLVAPVAIVLPVHFGTGIEAGPTTWLMTGLTAVVTGGVLGALTHGRSRRLTYEQESPAQHAAAAAGRDLAVESTDAPEVEVLSEAAADDGKELSLDPTLLHLQLADGAADDPDPDPTVGGTERSRGTKASRPKKPDEGFSWSSGCGCLHGLTFVGLLVGGVLYATNYLMSAQFAATVGVGNALAVLFVAIAFVLYRLVERRLVVQTGRFIRPAEAIRWSLGASVRAGLAAALLGLLLAYPAARFLDGWLGNRPEARIQFRGRAFAFEGQGGIGGHFLGLSDQGVALALFVWLAIVVAGIALGGVRSRVIEMKTRPNEGMRLSVRNALFCLWAVGLPAGAVLGGGLYLIPTVARHVPFVRTSKAVPVELLEARLRPRIQRFAENIPVLRERLAASPDTAAVLPTGHLFGLYADFALLRLVADTQAINVADLTRRAAALLHERPSALLPGSDVMRLYREHRGLLALATDREIAGTPERVAELLASVPRDSLPPGVAQIGPTPGAADRAFGLGLALGLAIGGLAALLNGGMAVLRHGLLRLKLRSAGVAPLRYAEFLDYAADELGFLQRVGGGWMFIHRYLLEYFAEGADAEPPATA